MGICQAGSECESRRRPDPLRLFRRRRLRQPIRKVAGTKAHVARFDVQRHSLKIGPIRRGGRVAEGARLESVFTGNRNVGSNPTPSANICFALFCQQKQRVMATSNLSLVTGLSYSSISTALQCPFWLADINAAGLRASQAEDARNVSHHANRVPWP